MLSSLKHELSKVGYKFAITELMAGSGTAQALWPLRNFESGSKDQRRTATALPLVEQQRPVAVVATHPTARCWQSLRPLPLHWRERR